MLPGRATSAGTARYREQSGAPAAHFRSALGDLWLSSLGIGTYLGRDDAATDALYAQSVRRALQLGVNVIDTAINYRNQRSERAVGAALRESGQARDGIVVCTKGGYLAFDGGRPHDARGWVEETVLKPGLATGDEIVAGCHCLSPRFLEAQLEQSRRNLRVECVDVYYLHNPETQLGEVPRPEFQRRLRAAFEMLERACADGRIGWYGTATWNGYRLEADEEEFLSLSEVVAAARDVAGERHRCRALQLPFNVEMDEAATLPNQGDRTLLEAAGEAGMTVFASASVLQGRLTHDLPPAVRDALRGLQTDAQRALQFARSSKGITCALVGMKTLAHVEENAAVCRTAPLAL